MGENEELVILEMCDEDQAKAKAALHRYLSERGLPILASIKKLLSQHGITFNVEEMAEEIFQELAYQLLRRAKEGSLLEVKSLGAYVYGAAKRCTLNYLRKEAGRPEFTPTSETFWEETDRIQVEDGLIPSEQKEFEEALFECIKALPARQQTYIRMRTTHYDDPPTPAEIAEMHGVSPESVRNRLLEARRSLEGCLKKKGHSIPLRRRGGRK